VAENRLVSQVGLCSMEYVTIVHLVRGIWAGGERGR